LNVSFELAQQCNQTSKEKSKTLEEQVMQLEKQTAVAQDKIKVLTVSNEKAEGDCVATPLKIIGRPYPKARKGQYRRAV